MKHEGMVLDNTFTPEVRAVELIGSFDSSKGSLNKVSSSSCLALSLSVNITNACELEKLLCNRRSNETGTTGSRHQADLD